MSPRPQNAKSDAASVLPLQSVEALLVQMQQIAALRKDWKD